MSENGKDYYNIAQMTKAFRAYDEKTGQSGSRSTIDIEMWQARAMFAIAQQLSIISAHLGTITKGIKNDVENST